MSRANQNYGSVSMAIIAGILLLFLLGWFSIYGWIIAGLAAGLIARGSGRGALSGVIAGAITSAIVVAVAWEAPSNFVQTIQGYSGTGILSTDILGLFVKLKAISTEQLVKNLVIDAIIVPAIGGFIGGSLLRHESSDEVEYEETEAEVQAPTEEQHPQEMPDAE